MKVTRFPVSVLLATLALCACREAVAHHSYAMFDRESTRTYAGVVRTWEFASPHAYLWIYINDAQGTPQLWGIEGGGPQALLRAGWNKNTVKPGDKVTVTLNPLRDGRNGGNLLTLTLADGRTLNAGSLPGAPGGEGVLNNGPGSAQ